MNIKCNKCGGLLRKIFYNYSEGNIQKIASIENLFYCMTCKEIKEVKIIQSKVLK